MSEDSPSEAKRPAKDYERELGVVEALVAITQECESGPVRRVAEHALETIKRGKADVMREQVYYVLSALQGWRGQRARQVHASLTAFYARSARDPSSEEDD